MALESLPKIAPALFSAEQDLIQIYNKKSDTVGTINASYIGGSTPPSGVSGAIQFSNGSAFASDSANLFWDDANNRLGIGTNAPITAVDVNGSIRAGVNLTVVGEIQNPTVGVVNINGELRVASPNVSIGLTSYPARLAVRGSGSTAATTALLVQNSLGNNALTIKDDLSATFSNTVYGGGFVFAAVSELYLNCRVTTTNPVNPQYRLFSSEGNASQTIAPTTSFHDIRDFTPTSGSALYTSFEYSGTINQTGGANGITRGLYINPTLTAAADFRAIEATQGNVLIGNTASNTAKLSIKGSGTSGGTTALLVQNNAGTEYFAVQDNGTVRIANNQAFRNGTIGGSNYFDMGNIIVRDGNAGPSGSISIGTGSAATAKLQIQGSGTTSGTTSLLVQNSGGTAAVTVKDDLSTTFGGNISASNLTLSNGGFIYAGTQLRIGAGAISILSDSANSINFSAGASGRSFGVSSAVNGGPNSTAFLFVGDTATGVTMGSNSNSHASAVLDLVSTTRGFLPPRMTDAEVRAIVAPAVGLMAYNTDLDCPVFYSAAGWRKVSHSVM